MKTLTTEISELPKFSKGILYRHRSNFKSIEFNDRGFLHHLMGREDYPSVLLSALPKLPNLTRIVIRGYHDWGMRYTERRKAKHPLLCVADRIQQLYLATDDTSNDQITIFSDPGTPDVETREQQFAVGILATLTQLTSLCLEVWMLDPQVLNAINSLAQLKLLLLEARNVTHDFLAKTHVWIQGKSLLTLYLHFDWSPELLESILPTFGEQIERLEVAGRSYSYKDYSTRSTRKFSFPFLRNLSISQPCSSILEQFSSSPLELLRIGDYFQLRTTVQAPTSITEQTQDLVRILSILDIAGLKLGEETTEDCCKRTSEFLKDFCEPRGLRFEYDPQIILASPSPSASTSPSDE